MDSDNRYEFQDPEGNDRWFDWPAESAPPGCLSYRKKRTRKFTEDDITEIINAINERQRRSPRPVVGPLA